jgi:two-component system CheB/CheR fusion protein
MALKANTVAGDQLSAVLEQLAEIRQVDFSCYRRSTLARRLEQRMRMRNCVSAAQYCALLRDDPAEADALATALVIKVTGFFRDSPLWDKLRHSILPEMVERAGPGGEVRVWSIGCASGEEAYSIAMLLHDLTSTHDFTFKVFATDRDAGAIAAAGRGRFSGAQVHVVPAELLNRWFVPSAEGYMVRRELRRSIVFGVHDLVKDAPISRLDLILCRNLFIYLDAAGQRRSLMHLSQALKPADLLVLGKSELLPAGEELFTATDLELRIYRKCSGEPHEALRRLVRSPVVSATGGGEQAPYSVGVETYAAALNAVDCAVVMVSRDGIVTFWNYGAERLFGHISSEVVGKPLSALKLRYAVGERMLERLTQPPYGRNATEELFTVKDGSGSRIFRLKVRPLAINRNQESGAVCLIWDVTELHQAVEHMRLGEERQEEVNAKYRKTIAELQASNEHLERVNEELRSVNQELQTVNEELQSTNQELEALNEELRLTLAEAGAARGRAAGVEDLVRKPLKRTHEHR